MQFQTTAAATVTASIYRALPATNTFSPIASVVLVPSLTGIISTGTILTGTANGLAVPLSDGQRLLLVLSLDVIGDIASTIVGSVSAGINIV